MLQKISPSLWFEDKAEEAINFYVSIFPNSGISSIKRYPTDYQVGPVQNMGGKVLTAVFELMGKSFMALDGGPFFKFNPTVSLTITAGSVEEAKSYWEKLSPGGQVLMPFQKWPFSEGYGWLNDKYGVSWQINTVKSGGEIIPSLMFVGKHFGECETAINFYTGVFKNSKIAAVYKYEPGEQDEVGKIKHSYFFLENTPFIAMESSHEHKFEVPGAISFYVECENQEEVDYYWMNLSAAPEKEQCGWLQDQFGFAWQIIPKRMGELLSSSDSEKAKRAMEAMLKMKKIDLAELERAYNG